MARRDDHECAYCATDLASDFQVIGRDWKVYCGVECAEAGAELAEDEAARHLWCQSAPATQPDDRGPE